MPAEWPPAHLQHMRFYSWVSLSFERLSTKNNEGWLT